MAVCRMEMLAVGNVAGEAGLEHVRGRRQHAVVACAKPQRVMVSATRLQKRWPSVVSVRVQPCANKLRLIRVAASGGDNADPPKKSYDVNEVVEKVIHEEENQLPTEEMGTPEPLPEGEASPFSPADTNTDDPFADDAPEGEGIYKESLIMPSKAAASSRESAASSSIGDDVLGVNEQSALGGDPVVKSGGRDWRVHSASKGLYDIFEDDGGNSVDDYKLRAHIFSESAAFFTALKNRESSASVV